MNTIKYDDIDNLIEDYREKIYDEIKNCQLKDIHDLFHIINCHAFNDLKSDIIKYIESKGIEVE